MTQPTVSVIIPAFNAADTVRTALGSVQGQSFRRWEAVVIDDGSKDCTAEVVASLALGDGRIRYHKSPSNRGPSAARNAGLAKAQGEYVMFLDADDWIGKDHISRLVHALRRNPLAGGAYTGYTIATEGGLHERPVSAARPESLFQYAARACPFSINACLVKRKVVEDARGFDESLVVAEDWDLWQRLARGSVNFLPTSTCSAYYRAHGGSHTRSSGRLIPDGSVVIRRGHSPDARVRNPKPEHHLGEPVADLPAAMLSFLIWATGYLVAAGSILPPLSGYLPKLAVEGFSETAVASLLFDGLMHGVGWGGAALAARWADLWPDLARSLGPLYSCSSARLDKDAIRWKVERLLVDELGPEDAPVTVGHIRVLRARFEDAWTATEVPKGVEIVRVYPSLDDRKFGVAELGAVPGPMSRRTLAAPVLKKHHSLLEPETRRFIRNNPRLLRQLVGRRTLYFLWDLLHVPRSRWRHRVAAYVSTRINSYLAVRFGLGPVQSRPQENPTLKEPARSVIESDPEQKRWGEVFATPDPWSYGSGYEQTKYEHTLELLPDTPVASALELACAEGHFTAQLAPRVGRLVAADISDRALSRAQQRCRNLQNITYRQMNLRRDLLGRFDLIVCSEALYYLKDRHELRRLAARFAKSLNPGGHLLMAHANLVVDDQGATGFDW
ncbi:MAG TPA: glycosyltransferase, partial [Terriglobia bacterium]|nr:glycosyltransferase [Terriglobia bacterium]